MRRIVLALVLCCGAISAQRLQPSPFPVGAGGGGGGGGSTCSGASGQILVSDGSTGCNGATPTIAGSTITASLTGAASLNLLKTNNLSDLASALTARTNLGVYSGTSNKIPKGTAATTLGDSSITDNGTTVSTTEPVTAPSFASGSAPPSLTAGTGGVPFGCAEGTPPTGAASGVDILYCDSTQHLPLLSVNGGAYNPLVAGAQYKTLSCQPGLGDGLNAITSGTYLESTCWNKTGVTYTITSIQCFTDNAGSSTLAVTNGAGTALLTGAVTCSSTIASGTQSGTTTIANNDFIKFTFVADGTSKQTTWVIAGTY